MRRLAVGVLFVSLVLVSIVAVAQIQIPEKYSDAAGVLAEWLVGHRLAGVPSWPFAWDPTRTDVGITMDIARVLNELGEITGSEVYKATARDAADFWVSTNVIDSEEAVSSWLWDVGGNVGTYAWEEGAFEKVQFAFAGSYWPVKGEHEGVRGGTISLCGSVVRPLAGLLTFGSLYADTISTVQQWLFTDLEAKMPTSGDSTYRAYMGAQTLNDDDSDGLLDVKYELWGSSRQSAGQNARLMVTLFDLGLDTEAVAIADWLLEVMWDEEQGSFHTLFDITEGSCMTFVEYQDYSDINARTAYGLLRAYEETSDARYLDFATRTLDWLIDTEMNVVLTGSGAQTYFTKPTVYGNHIIVVSLAKGYEITGNPKYLSAAVTTADFILGQMDTPFTGFEANAWTVQEALEAVLALLKL